MNVKLPDFSVTFAVGSTKKEGTIVQKQGLTGVYNGMVDFILSLSILSSLDFLYMIRIRTNLCS
jgi:hypothetical protein